jgi:uncharacterized protein
MVVVHRRWLVMLLAGLVVTAIASPMPRAAAQEVVPVIVATAAGEHLFRAELATTPVAQAQGLMFREHLDPDAGMLFLFDPPRRVAFWMKNTLIPLDMIFVDAAGRIVDIAARTEPHSLESQGPDLPVAAVLEINGGMAERLGIAIGDRVRLPALR